MACDPYKVVRDFEQALCDYTGAKYAVTVTSCTMALQLAVAYRMSLCPKTLMRPQMWIPARTYVSVPMAILHGGGMPAFRDEGWLGEYELEPWGIWDCARWFRPDMYRGGLMMCLSFHWTKHLAIGQGGAILHDNDDADAWLRRMRFDGRTAGVAPKDDHFREVGYHCYMSPRDAAEGLSRLAVFKPSGPLPNDDYPDLSKLDIFTT